MLVTLHLYLLRQLVRTFVFASIALVLLFVLGGGMANLIRGSGQVWTTLQIVLPIAFTLMTPVALLLSTTMTFGRLSADNEMDACRVSGINLYRMLLVPTALAVLATLIIGLGICQWIPTYIGRFTSLFSQNAQSLLHNQLMFNSSMRVGDFAFYTDEIRDDPSNRNRLQLVGAAVLESDKQGDVVRYGSAREAEIKFSSDGPRALAEVILRDVRMFDLPRRQWVESRLQPFGPYELPSLVSNQVKWQPFHRLMDIWRDPLSYEFVANRREQLVTMLTMVLGYRDATATLAAGRPLVLNAGNGVTYTVTGTPGKPTSEDRPLPLSDVRVETRGGASPLTFTAPSATLAIELLTAQRGLRWVLTLRADRERGKVLLFNPQAPGMSGKEGYPHDKYTLEPCPLDDAIRRQAEAVPVDDLLKGAPKISPRIKPKEALADPKLMVGPVVEQYGPQVGLAASTLRNTIRDTDQQIRAEVNYRLSYSLSTLILIPLGACLGIIFRGAHVLTAFALSGLPGLLVIFGIVLGRNQISLGQNALGVSLIWGGNVICAAVLLYVLMRALRR